MTEPALSFEKQLLHYCQERQDEMIGLVRQLVELESPTHNKPLADRCSAFLARELAGRGAEVRVHPQPTCGDQLEARFSSTSGANRRPIMLLGHYDTVWEAGTLARNPFRESGGRLFGPGVFDMKSGLAIMIFALEAVKVVRGALPRAVIVAVNADEETGSLESRDTTEALARECEAVLVAEPGQGTAVKTARKGTGGFTLKVTGVAAHAGLDFSKGQNAILELARQIELVSAFTDLQQGLTVSVGFVQGGTAAVNMVPAEAVAQVDVRIAELADGPEIERRFFALRPFNPECQLQVAGGIHRPPLVRTPAVAALYHKARLIAHQLGFELEEAAVGGGSDGNFTAALGIPTLDGLGAVGEGAHAEHESVLVDWLPRRAALVAGLIASF